MSHFKSEEDGSNGFFRMLRKGVGQSVSRPVPGSVKAQVLDSKEGGEEDTPKRISTDSSEITSGIRSTELQSSPRPKKRGDDVTSIIASPKTERKPYRITQFELILGAENVDLVALRKLSWNGVPSYFRSIVWQMLLGYLPTNKSRREQAITRKRKEYQDSIPTYFNASESDRTTQEGETRRQILVDLPRTCPDTPFFQQEPIQRAMERILYIWSIRHPASGYVQGINDLLTPLLFMCMSPFVADVLRIDVATLEPKVLMDVEADSYWCLSKLLDNIQDHYTFSQPGISLPSYF